MLDRIAATVILGQVLGLVGQVLGLVGQGLGQTPARADESAALLGYRLLFMNRWLSTS